jgi:hypothetical protein
VKVAEVRPFGTVTVAGVEARSEVAGGSWGWPPRIATRRRPLSSERSKLPYACSTEACGAVEDGVEDGLQVVRRARNGAQHFRDGRLLLNEFGHPILRFGSGAFSVDTRGHAEQFLGLDGGTA